ncbi:MAG: putative enoyl-CoA hydratase/isomerase [Pseudonocardiales bacterium]|nr:putative enoyl-CoA hydratase/isomerase [Pseudonocardiales bacterium]
MSEFTSESVERRRLPELTTLLWELSDNVATVTLNRPQRLNSFTQTMAQEFELVWREVRENDDIHCVVLRAAGDRAFCTGIDIKEGPWWSEDNIFQQEDPGVFLGPKSQSVWKPVVTAVHGLAGGGAFYFINESDIVICSTDATFFDPHASGGMVSSLEPIGLIARGVPLGDVLRWALVGNEERITADTALRLGIVTEVVERDQLWAKADALAKEIASRRPAGIQGTVRAIWESLDMPLSMAKRNGLSYTQLGNKGGGPSHPAVRPETRYR